MIQNKLEEFWQSLVDFYTNYSDTIHEMFPGQAGDFVLFMINAVVLILALKFVADSAFKR